MTKKFLDDLTYKIIGAAIEVHKDLGPGLLESVYQKCLKQEFFLRELRYSSELLVPVQYKGFEMDTELRCDFLVEDSIVVELKAVDALAPVHEAQILTYMKLLQKPKGILINFNCANLFKEGQRTFVNELFRKLPDQ
ncbi:MAG TPA: GxxExxY protein [Cyclobacteriaceae bacterium]|nr:GxxExxY protein [Cyclobacteriaceae bacterium]HRJ81981.1 GxxExxY protein [Cyclobacteriaceae bacterium]